MAYAVAFTHAREQAGAFPKPTRLALAGVLKRIAGDPWRGERYDPRHLPELHTEGLIEVARGRRATVTASTVATK